MIERFDPIVAPLDGISLIEASAGTGKTWNLCALYLRLLLERSLQVQQILVVTFTIAATAELRERIRSRIVEALAYLDTIATAKRSDPIAATVEGDGYIPTLVSRLINEGHAHELLTGRLDLALQTFDEASIFTIHGFCQRALADTAFAAGLPFESELSTDDSDIVLEAVNDFWRRHVAADGFSPSLAAFMLEKYDTPATLARLVARHAAKPLARTLWPAALEVTGAAGAAGVAQHVATNELDAAFAEAREAWIEGRAPVSKLLNDSLSELKGQSYWKESIEAGALAWDSYFLAGDPIAELGDKADLLCASGLESRKKKNGTAPKHELCDSLDRLLTLRSNALGSLALARIALIRTLVDEVGRDLPRRKRERRVIAFNDMLSNLHTALHDPRYPWLAPSLRRRFPAALIDEFQDTDPVQFSIFDAIYGDTESALFLVGDPKQAIYSFRNADLYTYLAARSRAGAQYMLDQNQRSTRGLIEAVNGLFAANGRAFMLDGLAYQPSTKGQRDREPLNDRSEAEVHLDATTRAADLRVWMLPSLPTAPPLKRLDARTAAVRATAAEIARLIGEGNAGRIDIGGRRLQPLDIAVLVRSHAQGSEMKRALAALGIGSVELRQESVFSSFDADEVERLLMAINEPSRTGLLRAALATEMIGCNAADIIALSADESRLQQRIEQLTEWRETWTRQGAGVMFRQMLADEGVSARMLCRPDGERRLTNLLHLGEELHKAAQVHDTPEALLRWFTQQRREGTAAEATQLRLESDHNLVQIATIHKAKGLEFGIVFCPFLWDGFLLPRRQAECREYHDFASTADAPSGAVIDYRVGEEIAAHEQAIKDQMKLEDSAELLRLAYVAMTRAVYRCYIVAGVYSRSRDPLKPNTKESCWSLLNWLVAGNGETPESWWQAEHTADDIARAWSSLATACHPHIALLPIPMEEGKPVVIDKPTPESLVALVPPKHIAKPWRISSFSGLANGAAQDRATDSASDIVASDHDARGDGSGGADAIVRRLGLPPPDIGPDDILRFPRGTNAGDCLHAAFERIDFGNAATWKDAIAYALGAHPQANARSMGPSATTSKAALTAMIERMLTDVTSTQLLPGLLLRDVPLQCRLTELEFSVPAGDVLPSTLNRWLAASGYEVPRLAYGGLEGYLKGFIDLVFEHDRRYWILDWKSNHLGWTVAEYGSEAIGAAMVEHAYHLQHLIYTIALHRYLSHRMKGYRYEQHFGGVLYAFVRGVRPQWKNPDGTAAGVFHHRPDVATIDWLDGALRGEHRRRA